MQVEPVRMGFVGAGYMGQLAHIGNYAHLDGARMVALAEPRERLREQVAERYGIARTVRDHRDLARDPDVEAVAAIMGEDCVTAVVRDLLQAGKHVITEKPMGVRSAECRELAELAADRGLVYQVGYMKRHDPGVLAGRDIVRELLAGGRLGALRMARAWNFAGDWKYGIEEPITTEEQVPEDVLTRRPLPDFLPNDLYSLYRRILNVECHGLNLLRFLLGEEYAFEQVAFRDTDRPFILQGWSRSGVNCVFEIGSLSAPRWHEGVELFFDDGIVRIEPPPPLRRQAAASVTVHEMGDEPRVVRPEAPPAWAFEEQAAHLLRSVRGEEPPASPASDAVRDIELAEQAVRLVVAQR